MPLLERGLPFITEIHLTGNAPHIPMNVRKAGGYVDDAVDILPQLTQWDSSR